MNNHLKGAAKRLTFSLMVASVLGGCAVEPSPYGRYSSYPYDEPGYYPEAFFDFGFDADHRDHDGHGDHDRGGHDGGGQASMGGGRGRH